MITFKIFFWEKIFVNKAADKGLISKRDKQHMQLSIKKSKLPSKTWAEDLNKKFSKDILMAKQMKKCSTSL